MMGGLSILAVGLVIGVAAAWVLPGLPQLLRSAGARAAPRVEKPAGEPDGPKNDQPRLVKLDADEAVRVRDDDAGAYNPTDHGVSWIDFFESKCFGACFGGLVSVVTLQVAGADARSTFALTLLIVLGYWLAIEKPR